MMSQPKGIGKKNLQCPFTWKPSLKSDEDLKEEEDSLLLAPNPWASAVNRLALAYQYVMKDDIKQSERLIAECYIPLLSVEGLSKDCELVLEYREALKHIVDATWAFICCKSTSVTELEPFLQSITPFDRMDAHQRAAVWGIRGKILDSCDGLVSAQVAVDLSPKEGQWHLYKGLLLLLQKRNKSSSAVGAIKELNTAYTLRPTSETTVHLAATLAQQHRKPVDVKKGLQMLREAAKKWPDSAFVNLGCGMAVMNQTKPDLVEVEKYFRIAVKLENKCSAAHYALGSFLLQFRDKAEGRKHLRISSLL